MDRIGKLTIDFRMENKAIAHDLYSRWETFFTLRVARVIEEVLQKNSISSSIVEINELELDLGCIYEDKLDEQFPVLLKEQLEEALIKMMHNPGQGKIQVTDEKEYIYRLFCRFLLHGFLPWNVASRYRDINRLFLAVLEQDAQRLKIFLLTYGHYTSLRRRLVSHLNDPGLERGIRLIAPDESHFICSYLRLLHSKYGEINRPQIQESEYRTVTWLIVYNYLLEQGSSWFNRRSFLKSILTSLATAYNLTYEHLLNIVTYDLAQWNNRTDVSMGLLFLLVSLRSEWNEKKYNTEQSLFEQWCRILRSAPDYNPLWFGEMKIKPQDILLHASLCRKYLQPLTEKQIYRLVKFIQPAESEFIITYARSLDDQQNSGILQGKTGGEFRLLKWQIIFPVLLQNHHVVFNRIGFLLDVISRIASHYNLTVKEIINYLYREIEKKEYTSALRNKLKLLWEKIHRQEENKLTLPPGKSIESIRKQIRQKKTITNSERNTWIQQLTLPLFRWKLIDKLTENEHYQLLEFIIPLNSRFIIVYAKGLDRQPVKGALQGKAGSGFARIKWEFLYRILIATRQHVFNKTYFVESTLTAISRHYNVPVKDLVNYFLQDKDFKNHLFPAGLMHILEKLSLATARKDKLQENIPIPFTVSHYSYIENAGLVLVAPFLPLLFTRLSLIENGGFSSDKSKLQAIWLLQYILYGEDIPPGASLYLNYLLTGLHPEVPVCEMLLPGQEEKQLVKSLLQSILTQWKKLKGTSVEGLQQAFLQRAGKIEEKGDAFYLYVEEKAYDMLLDTIPWNYRTIKTSWMNKPIYVKWR